MWKDVQLRKVSIPIKDEVVVVDENLFWAMVENTHVYDNDE